MYHLAYRKPDNTYIPQICVLCALYIARLIKHTDFSDLIRFSMSHHGYYHHRCQGHHDGSWLLHELRRCSWSECCMLPQRLQPPCLWLFHILIIFSNNIFGHIFNFMFWLYFHIIIVVTIYFIFWSTFHIIFIATYYT